MKILVAGTQYTLLFYMVISSDWRNTYYVFPTSFPESLIKKLNQIGIKYYKARILKKGFINYYYNRFKFFYEIKKLKKVEVFGSDYSIESWIFRNNGMILIEDGVANYLSHELQPISLKNRIKNWMKLYFSPKEYTPFGYSDKVKKIYLSGLSVIPKKIEHKVEIINLKELWDKKTLEEQNEILDIFSFDSSIKEKIKGRDMILFTQPLSEDKILTEEEKIEIYSKIVKKYPKDKLIIKTHPREKTDYKNIFKEYLVLDNPFPFEILNLLDVKFTKAITLFSTAALGLGKNVETDFYGTEIHPKIFDRVGSCDNIMKRNCFLKEEK